jgi:hypothetical protein
MLVHAEPGSIVQRIIGHDLTTDALFGESQGLQPRHSDHCISDRTRFGLHLFITHQSSVLSRHVIPPCAQNSRRPSGYPAHSLATAASLSTPFLVRTAQTGGP